MASNIKALPEKNVRGAPETRAIPLPLLDFSDAAVTELIRELVAHELVSERPDDMPARQPAFDAPQPRLAWAPPSIQVYTDMQDFLRLDPIHDVTPAGWPHANAG